MTTYDVPGNGLVDINFIVLCKEHESAIGPFADIDGALHYVEKLHEVAEAAGEEVRCQFDVLPVIPPVAGVVPSGNTYEPRGYL